jgi:hypothetical protein
MASFKVEEKQVHIFDNVFDSHYTQKFYTFIINSYFKINMNDSNSMEYSQNKTFGAGFSKGDIDRMGIIRALPKNIKEKFNINIDSMQRALVNAISQNGSFHPHDDAGDYTKWSFLYYANLKWDLEWGADTLFLNNDRKNISNIVQCKPNRVVVFDASIPHLIRPSTIDAPTYRFSLNMTFKDNNEK